MQDIGFHSKNEIPLVLVLIIQRASFTTNQPFLKRNFFLKPTCTVFTKILTFTNVVLFEICSSVKTEFEISENNSAV